MALNGLTVGFVGTAVTIQTDDPALRSLIRQYFQHCLTENQTPIAQYHIRENSLYFNKDLLRAAVDPVRLLEPWLQHMMEQLITANCQHLVLHAAGLAWQDQGVLLCGVSGSGKSTLTAVLAAAGADYLSDEMVAVNGELMLGFARPLVLKEGSAFVWREAALAEAPLALPGRLVWIRPLLLRPDCVRQSARPGLILFPRYEAGVGLAIRPLSTAETVYTLMQHLVNARNLPGYGLMAVRQLAQQTTAYQLTYGSAQQVVDWLESL
ncbi:MAG: hypothetical protein HF973_03940 [Chloroflexi bacterium]|nr:hypothetical protein [Chloroflexota bacterium]